MILKVLLNGTDTNPVHTYELTYNPLPQWAKYEYNAVMLMIQSLGSDPIPNIEYIRNRLRGFHPAFVDMICEHYKPGEMIHLEIEIPGKVLRLPFYEK